MAYNNGCVDSDPMCCIWANSEPSECVNNPSWMLDNCKASCNTCGKHLFICPTKFVLQNLSLVMNKCPYCNRLH